MQIRVDIDVRQFNRRFKRLRTRSLAFGVKNATDRAGNVFKTAMGIEWRRKLNVKGRGRNFIRNALQIQKALVDPTRGIATRHTRVVSRPWSDEILNTQIRGKRNRRTQSGKDWAIPINRRSVPKKNTFLTDDKLVFRPRKRGNDVLVGVIRKTIDVPKHVRLRPALMRTQRAMVRLMEASLRREFRRQERRTT